MGRASQKRAPIQRGPALRPGFNVRVYGVLLSPENDQVLLLREQILGRELIKFPGGGVEKAEAPGAALIREFREELGIDIELDRPYYFSGKFHQSLFRPQQLISLYWRVLLPTGQPTSRMANLEILWRPLLGFDLELLTHPADREVASQLLLDCSRV